MKKLTCYFLIMIILFNFIFCNNAYADDTSSDINDLGTSGIGMDPNDNKDLRETTGSEQQELLNEGRATDGNIQNNVSRDSVIKMLQKAVAATIAMVINCVPLAIQSLMCLFAYDSITNSSGGLSMVTVEDIVFGEIEVLNVDFFNFKSSSKMMNKFRKSVAQWYYSLRLVAVALDMLVLIYVGIRMVLSVTSSDKAKYKEMLISWVGSVFLIFILHYIIAFMLQLGSIFTNAIVDMKSNMTLVSFEKKIMTKTYTLLNDGSGWEYVAYSVFFWVIVFIQLKFFSAYAKRLITTGFLILISPLVCAMYAIDKVGDGKAQSFSNWLKELGVNVFIQPLEALFYVIFMSIAAEIASESMLLTLIFLLVFTKAEKTMLQLFRVRGMSLHLADDEKGK